MANSKPKSEIRKVQYNARGNGDGVVADWWNTEKEKEKHIWPKVRQIRLAQSRRRTDFMRFARLYSNADFEQFLNGISSGHSVRKLSFNVIRSCVDTACARIAKSKTRPLILTNGGDHSQMKRAQKLTQYLDGMFDNTKIYRHGKRAFREGCVFGTGIMKIFVEEGQVKAEKVFIDEIVVDDLDARSMSPRELHQVKLIPRDRAMELYADTPAKKAAIQKASVWFEINKTAKVKIDLIGIIESWHLRSGSEATDGRHVISLEQMTLVDDEYDKDYFPFVNIHWNEPLLGYFGEGLSSQLVGIQLEINTVLMRIKESQEIVSVPRVLVQKGSGVNASHLTDEIGGIVYYQGQKPEFQTAQGLNKDAYDYLEYLYQKAFQDTGISQLSAVSKKPAGLDSGIALREYQDIETERFVLVGERYQDMYLDAAKIMIDLQRDLAKEDKQISIKVKGRDFIETIKWKDCDLDDDKFVMTAFPTSMLPKTPEGQLQFTQELVQSGFVDQTEALSLMDFPDLKAFFRVRTAALDDVTMLIENMIDKGEYTAPEPYMDLNLAIRMVQSAYLRGKTNGVPETRLELLRRFIDQCQLIITKATQPAPGPLTQEAGAQAANGGQPLQPGQGQVPPPGAGAVGPQGPGPNGGPGAIARHVLPIRSDLVAMQKPAPQ